MAELVSLRATVYGRVQGVYFRAFTHQHATALGLNGYVRNLPGGRAVEVQAEGEREKLERLIDYLKVGPSGAEIARVDTDWSEYRGNYSSFHIRYS